MMSLVLFSCEKKGGKKEKKKKKGSKHNHA